MSQITRPLAAAFSLLVLWLLAMVLEALRIPGWAMVMAGGLLLVNVIVLTGLLHQVTREQERHDGDEGLRSYRPDVPGPGGGGEPNWWPQFERDLAQYLADTERGEGRPERVPAGSVEVT